MSQSRRLEILVALGLMTLEKEFQTAVKMISSRGYSRGHVLEGGFEGKNRLSA